MNKMNFDESVINRFWSKVNIPKDLTQCWEWQAGQNGDGYGHFFIIISE